MWYTDPRNLARLLRYLLAEEGTLSGPTILDVLERPDRWAPEFAIASVPCPECKAPAGDCCRNIDTGARLRGAHSTRIEDATR